MHAKSMAREVLDAVKTKDMPFLAEFGGLRMEVKWKRRWWTVNGVKEDVTGRGDTNGVCVVLRSTVNGAAVSVRGWIDHDWKEEELVQRVTVLVTEAKLRLRREVRRLARRVNVRARAAR